MESEFLKLENETLKLKIETLKKSNEQLQEQLKSYTNPSRYKKYYEANKAIILQKKKKARSSLNKNFHTYVISKMLAKEMSKLSSVSSNNDLAQAYGLSINTVTWEDSSRTKNSCWGPNISDLTLVVNENNTDVSMNMIRKPNFSDVSADLPSSTFTVTVGNEVVGGALKRIPLEEYVKNIGKYNTISGNFQNNLWNSRDSSLLVSAQCCVLPLGESGETEFCPRMYNYQSAVLVITSTSQGTSSIVMSKKENLHFNRNGRKVKYLAKRLKQDRKERGVSLEGKMNSEEEDRNVIIIYQIPLLRKTPVSRGWPPQKSFSGKNVENCSSFTSFGSDEESDCGFDDYEPGFGFDLKSTRGCVVKTKKRGMDNAMLQASSTDLGSFESLDATKLERDVKFPIRVTYQFYKVSDDPVLSEEEFQYISKKISDVYESSSAHGSLVTNLHTERPTESFKFETLQPPVNSQPLFSTLRIS
jgi:hypothetical protein